MKIEQVRALLLGVSQVAPLVPLLVAFRTRPLLWWYALAGLTFDSLALGLRQLQLPYHWTSNCFLAAEFILLSLYYWKRLRRPSWLAGFASFVFLGFSVHTLGRGFDVANLPGAAVLCIVYMLYALQDFYHLLRRPRVFYLEQSQGFWINTAILFYAATTCFLFLFYQGILEANPVNRLYWACFFFSMNIFRYLLLATALRAKHP